MIWRRINWVGCVSCMEQLRNGYIFFGKHKGKRPLGRPRCKWEDNRPIMVDFKETECETVDMTHLVQDVTFGFHERQCISWPAEWLSTS
jgi:hypothetical protein